MGRALGMRRAVLLLSMGLGSVVAPLLIDRNGVICTEIRAADSLANIVRMAVRQLGCLSSAITEPSGYRPEQ